MGTPDDKQGEAGTADTSVLLDFVARAANTLAGDERVWALWLTGSLAAGTGDAWSDVDLRAAIHADAFAALRDGTRRWRDLVETVAPVVWARRWPGPPDELILGAITTKYVRFDLVLQSADDLRPRHLVAARALFDKDGLAERLTLTVPEARDPLAALPEVVDEFIRLVGMLPIVVGRDDVPIGMEGQMGLHGLLIALLLMEGGIDRMASGKRHVAALLDAEQRAVLASVPTLAPTMASVVEGRLAYARIFLPRARRLMAAHGLTYPQAFEDTTRAHLVATLGVSW
ncbi:MAG TPA: hypothetical protein VIC85_16050 [Ktedonobacterales bacterium]|jgi:hypothetical protein